MPLYHFCLASALLPFSRRTMQARGKLVFLDLFFTAFQLPTYITIRQNLELEAKF